MPALRLADLRTSVLWVLAIVPQAFGFWLVVGDVAGAEPDQIRTLLLGALLALGLATLAQVAFGYRLPLYEGPAAGYMGAVIVVAAAGHSLPELTGGLMLAGLAVALLGVLRFDRLLLRHFTPLTGMAFILVVTVAVLPTTLERAVAADATAPYGTAGGWLAAAAVLFCGIALQRRRALRPYGLLGALLAGTAVAALVDGVPDADLSGGLATPPLLPWGAPELSPGVAVPFLIGAAIVAFNTVAAVEVTGELTRGRRTRGASARGLVVHGGAQVGGAALGSVLGTVARLDSLPIASLLGATRRAPLALAALMIVALAFVQPFLGLVAALPLNVSAALLALMLGTMVVQTARRLWPLGRPARIVATAAVVPSIVWTPLEGSLPPLALLLANPMPWGVGIALVLERLLIEPET